MSEASARRRRHLIDPSNPPAPRTQRDAMRLSHVQMWVMSVLAVSTIFHMAIGLVLGAAVISDSERSAQIGLLVIAVCFGVMGMAVGRVIHKVSVLSWWLLPGLLPALGGVWWIWMR